MKFLRSITTEQAKDTGLAIILLLLIIDFIWSPPYVGMVAIILLVVDMILPSLFKPLAVLWFGFSNILGTVTSKIILGLIFLIIITPIGLIRRCMRKDSMLVQRWKQGQESVLIERNHLIRPKDMEQPF